jgi:hypothetical protein
MKKQILTIDNMIDVLLKAKAQIGGDAPINISDQFGTLILDVNGQVAIGKGTRYDDNGKIVQHVDKALVISGSNIQKTMDIDVDDLDF